VVGVVTAVWPPLAVVVGLSSFPQAAIAMASVALSITADSLLTCIVRSSRIRSRRWYAYGRGR
jgi:hypothetical protein